VIVDQLNSFSVYLAFGRISILKP